MLEGWTGNADESAILTILRDRTAAITTILTADMTERLMWHRLTPEMKETIERDGVYWEPSLYGDPYPITKHLIEEGRKHSVAEVSERVASYLPDPVEPKAAGS